LTKNENFIDSDEVSKITGYSAHSIRLFVKEGKLKVYRKSTHAHMRFLRSDVIEFMQSGSPAGE